MKTSPLKTLFTAIVLSVALAACAQTTTAGSTSFYQHASAIGGGR